MVLMTSSYKLLHKGDRAPNFHLKGTDEKFHDLYDIKKSNPKTKAFLIIFMCNHCPYVRPKMDYINYLSQTYSKKGLVIIGINPNDPLNYPADDLEHMKKENLKIIYLVDETQEVAKAYGAVCTPDPFLFDSNLKMIYHGRFDDAHGKDHKEAKTHEMEDSINQVLLDKEVTVQTFPSMGCSIKWKFNSED